MIGTSKQRDPTLPIRHQVGKLEDSLIREIAHEGMKDPDIIPLWFGEPDLPTPNFIISAANQALRDGHTFYAPNLGIPELRETLSTYMSELYERQINVDRLAVTSAAMNGMMIIAETLIDPGDNIVAVTPVWPNFLRCVEIMNGEIHMVPLSGDTSGWKLDLDRLFAACNKETRAIYINSPNNPTGWVMERKQQRAVLDFCREKGLWIISDEVYSRIIYDQSLAPSFIEIAEPEDLVIVINSFSKSWAMTGWRLGWVTGPPRLTPVIEKLNEYNVASPSSVAQHAGITAIRDGDNFIASMVDRYRLARDVIHQRLGSMSKVHMPQPAAAFYAFFSVDGMTDSRHFAKKLMHETKVGLAPGAAFGAGGENYLRICYAKSPEILSSALDRLAPVFNL
jgi:aspartate/methionine/tyrosine aminotransferase